MSDIIPSSKGSGDVEAICEGRPDSKGEGTIKVNVVPGFIYVGIDMLAENVGCKHVTSLDPLMWGS